MASNDWDVFFTMEWQEKVLCEELMSVFSHDEEVFSYAKMWKNKIALPVETHEKLLKWKDFVFPRSNKKIIWTLYLRQPTGCIQINKTTSGRTV